MINVCRVKISDFWIYPQPIRPGDWRATIVRPYNRAVQRQYIKPNRFAWKLRQALFDYAIDDDHSIFASDDQDCESIPGDQDFGEPSVREYDWEHIESGAYLDFEVYEDE
jgi:hypothetical protein